MLRAWLSLWLITASSTRPASICSPRNCSIFSDMPSAPSALGRDDDHCISRYQGVSALSGILNARDVAQHHLGRLAAHHLAQLDIVLGGRMRLGQDLDRRLRIAHGEPGGGDVLGRRPQLQHRLGDDAERAFGAHEQVLEVVAGIVLLERAQAVPDVAVGQHDLEAHHEVARVAVAQHLHAAGIGREIAADLAGALRAEAEREEAVMRRRRFLQGLQDAAGLRRSSSSRPDRRSAPCSCGRPTGRCPGASATGWRRPSGRCCRPAARSAMPCS